MLHHLVGLLLRALNAQVTGAKPLQVHYAVYLNQDILPPEGRQRSERGQEGCFLKRSGARSRFQKVLRGTAGKKLLLRPCAPQANWTLEAITKERPPCVASGKEGQRKA
jgi:hypothetical protein